MTRRDARGRSQDEVASWMKEGMKLKETRLEEASKNLLDMSLEDLFHVEPSRRGQRRASLFKQRMAEAEAEEAVRKGKGAQCPDPRVKSNHCRQDACESAPSKP